MSRKGKKGKRRIAKKDVRSQPSSKRTKSIASFSVSTKSDSLGKQCTTNMTDKTKPVAASNVAITGPSTVFVTERVTGMRSEPEDLNTTQPEVPPKNVTRTPMAAMTALEKSKNDEYPVSTHRSALANESNEQKSKFAAEESKTITAPVTRSRQQPQIFESESGEPYTHPMETSMFQGISRDSLQRYMAFYNVPGRYDLKSKLVHRVQAHFDTIDASKINLEELNDGIWERLRKPNQEKAKNRKK